MHTTLPSRDPFDGISVFGREFKSRLNELSYIALRYLAIENALHGIIFRLDRDRRGGENKNQFLALIDDSTPEPGASGHPKLTPPGVFRWTYAWREITRPTDDTGKLNSNSLFGGRDSDDEIRDEALNMVESTHTVGGNVIVGLNISGPETWILSPVPDNTPVLMTEAAYMDTTRDPPVTRFSYHFSYHNGLMPICLPPEPP